MSDIQRCPTCEPPERPQWVRHLYDFITDEIIDERYGYPDTQDADVLHEKLAVAVNEILCAEFGHEIINDHCGIPEHRYCAWCNKRVGAIAEAER